MNGDDSAFEILISHGFWQRRFGGDPDIVGRTLQIANATPVIVGVMPQDFMFPYGSMLGPSGFTRATTVDLWAPMAFAGPLAAANRMLTQQGQVVRGTHWLGAIGRMKPGVTVEQVAGRHDDGRATARTGLSGDQRGLGRHGGVGRSIRRSGRSAARCSSCSPGSRFVLVIAAVNVANLVLAQSIARQKEMATRVALGAGRGRMIQQALTEGLLLAAIGGLAGLVLARWGVCGAGRARAGRLAAPARGRRPTATHAADHGGGGHAHRRVRRAAPGDHRHTRRARRPRCRTTAAAPSAVRIRRRARAALVVAEVALAVTLTVGAGLLLRSFVSLMSVNPGFEASQMLTWQMNLPSRITTADERSGVLPASFSSGCRRCPAS